MWVQRALEIARCDGDQIGFEFHRLTPVIVIERLNDYSKNSKCVNTHESPNLGIFPHFTGPKACAMLSLAYR